MFSFGGTVKRNEFIFNSKILCKLHFQMLYLSHFYPNFCYHAFTNVFILRFDCLFIFEHAHFYFIDLFKKLKQFSLTSVFIKLHNFIVYKTVCVLQLRCISIRLQLVINLKLKLFFVNITYEKNIKLNLEYIGIKRRFYEGFITKQNSI